MGLGRGFLFLFDFLLGCSWLLCWCFNCGILLLLGWLLCCLDCIGFLLLLGWGLLLRWLGLVLLAISCLLSGCGFSLGTGVSGGRLFNFSLLRLCWWFGYHCGLSGSLCYFNLLLLGGLGGIGLWSLVLSCCTFDSLSFWRDLGGWLNVFGSCWFLRSLGLFRCRWLRFSGNNVLGWSLGFLLAFDDGLGGGYGL